MDFKKKVCEWITRKFRELGIPADVRVKLCKVNIWSRKASVDMEVILPRAELEKAAGLIEANVL